MPVLPFSPNRDQSPTIGLPQLTTEQAAAVMGVTGHPTMPLNLFLFIACEKLAINPLVGCQGMPVVEQLQLLFKTDFDHICRHPET